MVESSPGYDFDADKRKSLQKRRNGLAEEYRAASRQLDRTLSDVDRLRLRRILDDLESEIRGIDAELKRLR